jgi:hypothetical protein
MTDKESPKQGISTSRVFYIIGTVLMVFGIVSANAAFLGIGVVFFVLGQAQRDQKTPSQSVSMEIDKNAKYKLYIDDTHTLLDEISGEQLQFLVDNLEEEFLEDRDYAITRLTIDFLDAKGADPALSALLKQSLGEQEEITIIWKRA